MNGCCSQILGFSLLKVSEELEEELVGGVSALEERVFWLVEVRFIIIHHPINL